MKICIFVYTLRKFRIQKTCGKENDLEYKLMDPYFGGDATTK